MESLAGLQADIHAWSLSHDQKLLGELREFSQRIMTRTRELNDDLEELTFSSQQADLKLRNCFNQFLMLNQSQFIENRVYDDEEDESEAKNTSQSSILPPRKDMVSRFRESLSEGMKALDIYTPPGTNQGDEIKAKDYLNNQPLPYVIGTRAFLDSDTVGLPTGYEDFEEKEKKGAEDEESSDDSDEDEDTSDEDNSPGYRGYGCEADDAGIPPPPPGLSVPGSIPPPPSGLLPGQGEDDDEDDDVFGDPPAEGSPGGYDDEEDDDEVSLYEIPLYTPTNPPPCVSKMSGGILGRVWRRFRGSKAKKIRQNFCGRG
eukprot:1335505-Amorphochlora_amoeboformis.AAC.1